MDVGLEKMAKRVPRILMSSESLPPPSPSFALTARFSVQIFYARAGAAGLRSNANTPQDLIKKGLYNLNKYQSSGSILGEQQSHYSKCVPLLGSALLFSAALRIFLPGRTTMTGTGECERQYLQRSQTFRRNLARS